MSSRTRVICRSLRGRSSQTFPDYDIGTGSIHGAEICDLVGLYILDQLKSVFTGNYNNIGLFRDDGVVLVSKTSTRLTEALTKSF